MRVVFQWCRFLSTTEHLPVTTKAQKTITSTTKAIEDKELWLHLSQGLLLIAIVIAGALTLKSLKI